MTYFGTFVMVLEVIRSQTQTAKYATKVTVFGNYLKLEMQSRQNFAKDLNSHGQD